MFKAWFDVLFSMLDVFRYGRSPVAVVLYALFHRHLGMGLRKMARAISPFVSRSYNAFWRWEKRLKGLKDVFASKCSVSMYLVGDRKALIIVAYEPFHKKLLGIWLTSEKKDHVIAYFLNEPVKRFGKHPDKLLGHYSIGLPVDFWSLSFMYIHMAAGHTQ